METADGADDHDSMPLVKRKRLLLSEKPPPLRHPVTRRIAPAVPQKWPGLPRGVKFDPSDEDLMWHLHAEIGKGDVEPHPFISEFIVTLDDIDGFGCSHPSTLPGVKQDGSASYYFHRSFEACDTRHWKHRKIPSDEIGIIRWHKVGKSKALYMDGIHTGSKNIMALYMSTVHGEKPEKTNWVMHQFHAGIGEDEGEFIVSKIFYQAKCKSGDRTAENLPMNTVQAVGTEPHAPKSNLTSMDVPTQSADETFSDQVKNETRPADAGLLHDVCYVHPAECDAGKATVSVLIESPQSMRLGGEHAKLEPQSPTFSDTLVPVKAKLSKENHIISISRTISATQYSPDMTTDSFPSSIAPVLGENVCLDDPSSSGYKLQKKQKKDSGCLVSISDVSQSCLGQGLANENENDDDPRSKTIVSIFPLEVKVEPVEGSSKDVNPEENTMEHPIPLVPSGSTETFCGLAMCSAKVIAHDNLLLESMLLEEHISGNCGTSYQASDPKDITCRSNASQFVASNSGSLGTSMSASSCLINRCSAKASSPDVDFEDRDKLPDSVSSSCLERPKLECVENGLLGPCQDPPSILPELDVQRTTVKSECFDEVSTDVLDHIPLSVRMRTLKTVSKSRLAKSMKNSLPTALPPLGCDSFDSVNVEAKHLSRRRKKKKTATDSAETALEEDAPGLLKVLRDRGIMAGEIKLYGATEDDEDLPCSIEDSFEELETVITKLFSDGPSFIKLSLVRHIKGSKAVYCLACLISLIEQVRYLRFHQNPVEWGWCRDLQSFIFVFESHNRIVLERPEYGYATYFFELVATLPIDWQIKRLVTTMKLPCCGRSILLENKSLLVGEDLSEGEACVLEEYGWTRDTGIGTLLNFCDRVVHDKKNEMYSTEWRGKIAKLLMRGHDSGQTILSRRPKRLEQYAQHQYPEVKFESTWK